MRGTCGVGAETQRFLSLFTGGHDMSKPIPLAVGGPAPGFTLEATGGRRVSLSDFCGRQHVVLTFYPKNNTPG